MLPQPGSDLLQGTGTSAADCMISDGRSSVATLRDRTDHILVRGAIGRGESTESKVRRLAVDFVVDYGFERELSARGSAEPKTEVPIVLRRGTIGIGVSPLISTVRRLHEIEKFIAGRSDGSVETVEAPIGDVFQFVPGVFLESGAIGSFEVLIDGGDLAKPDFSTLVELLGDVLQRDTEGVDTQCEPLAAQAHWAEGRRGELAGTLHSIDVGAGKRHVGRSCRPCSDERVVEITADSVRWGEDAPRDAIRVGGHNCLCAVLLANRTHDWKDWQSDLEGQPRVDVAAGESRGGRSHGQGLSITLAHDASHLIPIITGIGTGVNIATRSPLSLLNLTTELGGTILLSEVLFLLLGLLLGGVLGVGTI